MASLASPTAFAPPSPPSIRLHHHPHSSLNFTPQKFNPVSKASDSIVCSNTKGSSGYSNGDDSGESTRRWDSVVQDAVKGAIKRFDDYVNANRSNYKSGKVEEKMKNCDDGGEEVEGEDWDWERWNKHFLEVDEQELVVSILKLQLAQAVNMENYEEAANLKIAIAAAASGDCVGKAISHMNKAVEEENYREAAIVRDHAVAGLVGWWAGLSDNTGDPYGSIIRISAEHGRYMAKSFSPRQLATAKDGAPLFEIFLSLNKKGEFRQQAVYLKRNRAPMGSSTDSSKSSIDKSDPLPATGNQDGQFENDSEDIDDADDKPSFENVLSDVIPGVEVKFLKVVSPGKVDRDFISKLVDQVIEDENEENDYDLESADSECENQSDEEKDDVVLDEPIEILSSDDPNQISVKVVVASPVEKSSGSTQPKELLRVPAKLEFKDRRLFTFTVEGDEETADNTDKSQLNKKPRLESSRSVDNLMIDLAKSIGKGKIPMKMLKDVGEMINLTLSQARNRQPLSGSTTFRRIELPSFHDPLTGVYVGAHGLHTSEVIQLRRRYGQWKEDGGSKDSPSVEFYEYVEAVKLTGDPNVPAGEIAFRAKVGKRYQLPHKGIIPQEFGVIARYKGQGRLAEPGFQNPRWADGELVILDGKYTRGRPAVGFVYWAPEYQYLVFFNRLTLQE